MDKDLAVIIDLAKRNPQQALMVAAGVALIGVAFFSDKRIVRIPKNAPSVHVPDFVIENMKATGNRIEFMDNGTRLLLTIGNPKQ